MRSFGIFGILLVFLFSACRSEETVTLEETTATTATIGETAVVPPLDMPTLTDTMPVPETATGTVATPGGTVATPVTQTRPATATQPAAQPRTPAATTPPAQAAQPVPPPTATQPAPSPAPPAAQPPAAQPPAQTTQPAATRAALPKTHTVDRGGVMHAPGAENPAQRCAACHGKDLRGGRTATSSCYSCHDQVW
jgi:outer membrane biosynthesis protein TonB